MRKPKLGQNFLVDEAACHAIASSLGDISGRTVVEVGPGHGAITSILAASCRRPGSRSGGCAAIAGSDGATQARPSSRDASAYRAGPVSGTYSTPRRNQRRQLRS